MDDSGLAKACIVNLDKGSKQIPCMFNPKEYTFGKQNSWKPHTTKGTNVPQFEFSGGQPTTLKMQLLFDTYASGKDVRKEYTEAVWDLMLVDPSLKDRKTKKGRPPRVRFQWGQAWSFNAVITNISQRFLLFMPTGTPVRAMLDVSFQQVEDEGLFPGTNPTSGGIGGERVGVVNAGDTLAWIAYKEYGDAGLWRRIADANRLTNVRRLTPGMALEVPNA
jgi:hypothetical protein